MQNWLSLLLIAIVLALNSRAQSLPDSLLAPITEELVEKDGLVYKVNYQDSLITVYKKIVSEKDQIITTYKLSEEKYKRVVADKQEVIAILDAENKDLRKEKVRRTFKEILLGVAVTAELVVIIILVL